MVEHSSERHVRFTINSYETDFETGITWDKRQVIWGLLCPHLVAYFFSASGVLLERVVKEWAYPAPRMGGSGPYQIYDKEFVRQINEQFTYWKNDLGFDPRPVSVLPFWDEERFVRAQNIPEHLRDPSDCETEEDREEFDAEIEEWNERNQRGEFVFYWAKDYYMSADGEVFST